MAELENKIKVFEMANGTVYIGKSKPISFMWRPFLELTDAKATTIDQIGTRDKLRAVKIFYEDSNIKPMKRVYISRENCCACYDLK